jgi:hypothetical protein
VSPNGLIVTFAAFGEAAAYRIAQQLERGDALLDAGVLALGEEALLLRRCVSFADAVASRRLDLAREPADVAFKLHQLGVTIFKSLLETLAAQLAPLDFGGIRSRLLDSGKRSGRGLLRSLAGRNFRDHDGIPGRAIGVGTERKIFRYALADHFELGLGARALGDSGFDPLLLFLARRVETGTARVERTVFLVVFKSFGVDLGLSWQSHPAGRRKRHFDRNVDFREHRLNLGAGRSWVVAGFEAFQLGKNSASAVFEFAPLSQQRISLGSAGHASGFQEVGSPRIERLALVLPRIPRRRHGYDSEITRLAHRHV